MEITHAMQAVQPLLFSSLLALVLLFLAWRKRYFSLPEKGHFFPVTFLQTGGVFLLYASLAFLILPVLNVALLKLFRAHPKQGVGVSYSISLSILFFALTGYCFLIAGSARRFIFWGGREPSFRRALYSLFMGLMTLAICYPLVSIVGNLTSLISLYIWKEAKVEQVAVEQLKLLKEEPLLFGIMIFLVVIVVPFMEELLFRGFLQSFLKRHLTRGWSLILTALIFALVHYAPSQGRGNFQLIASLLVLSVFLGFIYERERTLLAPIALHAGFNGLSVLMIMFS